MLDYAVEIEWFDHHLQKMINYLEEIGELENTIIVVTSDNGMAFPRAKANSYEYGVHVPFAVRFPRGFPGGRIVEDPIGFADIAPTILDITNTSVEGMLPMSGRSFRHLLESHQQGIIDESFEFVYSGRERHSASRYRNWGYPQRAVRSKNHILIWNIKPERWPAGAPQRIKPGTDNELLPMYGIDENGVHQSDWAFTDVDESPTKSFIVENWDNEMVRPYFQSAFEKIPEYLLFDIVNDPYCLENIADQPEYDLLRKEMQDALMAELTKTGDPRVVGPDTEVFDSYPRFSPMRAFPDPNELTNLR